MTFAYPSVNDGAQGQRLEILCLEFGLRKDDQWHQIEVFRSRDVHEWPMCIGCSEIFTHLLSKCLEYCTYISPSASHQRAHRRQCPSCGEHVACRCTFTATFSPVPTVMSPAAAFLCKPPSPSPRLRSHSAPRVICARQSPSPPPPPTPLLSRLDALAERTSTVKCPFWRRRFTDTLDAMRQVLTWAIVTRHKSILPSSLLPRAPPTVKTRNLPIDACLTLIREDFEKRQYYITGRLSTQIYRENCVFDGPDPDVPVRGLQKYTSATAGLFCRRLSKVQLIDITVLDERRIAAEWRLEGALNLPWKPTIKPYTGRTVYTFDEQRLVQSHVETWSISALDAFVSVLFKNFGAPPAASIEQILEQRAAREPQQR